MKKPATVKAVLASENSSILQDKRTISNIASPTHKSNLFGYPSLGEPYQRAKTMVEILDTIQSGMTTYHVIFDAFKAEYGNHFTKEFYREVNRYE